MKQDYIVTFIYGDEKHKMRIDAAETERDALRIAKVRARLMNYPIDENNIKIKAAAYQKKTTIQLNQPNP